MNRIVEFINNHETIDMFEAILEGNKNLPDVIQQINESRLEFQSKADELQWLLEKYIDDCKGGE
jgi:uncharacterized phage infection (PIP) family protein YhgE